MISSHTLLPCLSPFPPLVILLNDTLLLITLTLSCLIPCLILKLFHLLVPRPHLSFEAQLVAGISHEFGPISCPNIPNPPSVPSGIAYGKQKHDAELKYPQRIRRLNIFPPSKTEVVCFPSYWFFT